METVLNILIENAINSSDTFDSIRKNENNDIQKCNQRISFQERKIQRIKDQAAKGIFTTGYWTEFFMKPLAELIRDTYYPGMIYETLGPFGIRSSCSIHIYKMTKEDIEREIKDRQKAYDMFFHKDNFKASLTVIPVDISAGIYHYETGEVENNYTEGTIGEINGCNNVTKPIESLEELYKQMTKN